MSTPVLKTNPTPDFTRGIAHWGAQMVAAFILFGSILFLAAGRTNWIVGWVYLGMNSVTQLLSAAILIPRRPDMLAERSRVREGTKSWDHLLTPAITVFGTLAVAITAGLDVRFHWSEPFNSGLWGLGLIIAFCSQMFVLWAMDSNPFFAITVRIQTDRGHTVTSSGPYQFIRHPGYAGSLVYTLLVPLVLCSWWTFIPALPTIALIAIRTSWEDQTLQAELPGYREYAVRVRYRLVPGLW